MKILAAFLVVAIAALVYVLQAPLVCEHCKRAEEVLPEYDFIVIGGGSAGCVVASELAATGASVLLLEAGGPTNVFATSQQSIPGLAPDNVEYKTVDWNLLLEPQTAPLTVETETGFLQRRIPIPRGRVLGGSNELNFMLNVRGTPGDYDGWAEATGDKRWGAAHMMELHDRYEEVVGISRKGAGIPGASPAAAVADAWVAAAGNTKYGNTTSYNGATRAGGMHLEHAVKNGVRSSTARAFLRPAQEAYDNLHVVVNALVTKIDLSPNGKEAVGCQVEVEGPAGVAKLSVKARKEVVVSAGAYHSPHLLMLSGVGPREVLSRVGIDQKVDLPVGRHLQDHPIIPMKYRTNGGSSWWPKTLTLMTAVAEVLPYLTSGTGALASSGADFGLFAASNETYATRPDIQVHALPTAGNVHIIEGLLGYSSAYMASFGDTTDYSIFSEGFLLAPTLLHAKAEGTVDLRDRDARSPPLITYDAYTHEEDLNRLVTAVRIAQEVVNTPPLKDWNPEPVYHREIAAALGEDTDEYWKEVFRSFGFLVYHPTGTCRMGKVDDARTVVGPDLRVKGIRNLRVADASIMPEITSGNTQAPSAVIGLRMAEILREEHSL